MPADWRERFRRAYDVELQDWLDAVAAGTSTGPSTWDGYVVAAVSDAALQALDTGERVLVSSRRGSVEAPVHVDPGLRPGLVFMTFHFPEEVETNVLTIDATDPRSGTAEFKASAVRIDKLPATVSGGSE